MLGKKDVQMLMLSMCIMEECLEKIDLVLNRKLPLSVRRYLLNLHITYQNQNQETITTKNV